MKPVILALDFPAPAAVELFLSAFDQPLYVKVGMELFYGAGPGFVTSLKEKGHNVFLDLKLHDIPNTVKRAAKQLASLGADIVNVHTSGGKAMMEAAMEGLDQGKSSGNRTGTKCIAVTQLTSTSQEVMESELLISMPITEVVTSYARLALESGLHGVVCSPWEAPAISSSFPNDFMKVTPGIRMPGNSNGDQKRVATPAQAKELGSDAIVVGRSVTRAKDPVLAYNQILADWSVQFGA